MGALDPQLCRIFIWDSVVETKSFGAAPTSVVEQLQFLLGSAPAPASPDGGSGSSSSSSPVVHNLLPKKKVLQTSLLNLPVLVLFKER